MMPKSASATQNVFSFFSASSKSRPGTSSGDSSQQPLYLQQPQNNVLTKDRKGSFPRKSSFSSPTRNKKRSASSGSVGARSGAGSFVTDSSTPPALPDYALSAAAKVTREGDVASSGDSFSRILGRTSTAPMGGLTPNPPPGQMWQGEAATMHRNMKGIARKRLYTLDYLRKAYVCS